MEETEGHNRNRNEPPKSESYPRSKFWIDIATLIVLSITMVGVLYYACEARRQNEQLSRSVAEEVATNRAVVLTNGIMPVKKDTTTGNYTPTKKVLSDTVAVVSVNFGKTVAQDVELVGMLAFEKPELPAPFDPECDYAKEPPKDKRRTALAPVNEAPGGLVNFDTDIWTLRSGDDMGQLQSGDILYAVGCIYYRAIDGKSYYSDVCTLWRGDSFQSCSNVGRNFIR